MKKKAKAFDVSALTDGEKEALLPDLPGEISDYQGLVDRGLGHWKADSAGQSFRLNETGQKARDQLIEQSRPPVPNRKPIDKVARRRRSS